MTVLRPESVLDTPDVVDASGWRCIDFLSDLHLQASEPETFHAWVRHMAQTPAQAVFILGDLFEVWVGDDVLDAPSGGFERECLQVLQQAAQRLSLFWLCGNRDFLTGTQLARAVPWRALSDPGVVQLPAQRLLLSHGDRLCLDDHAYQAFRQEVRSSTWQQAFLARPLAERQALALHLRQQSMAKKASGASDADADTELTRQWLMQSQANVLLHGHTHKPGQHDLGNGLSRWVLSDWDLQAQPPRGEVLRWDTGHWQRVTVHPHQV